MISPIIGRTEEEARAKYAEALEYANYGAGLLFWSGGSGVDMSQFDLDQEITSTDVHVDAHVHTTLSHLQNTSPDIPSWAPQNIGNGLPSARMVLSMSVLEDG